jgi:hypothetical protein
MQLLRSIAIFTLVSTGIVQCTADKAPKGKDPGKRKTTAPDAQNPNGTGNSPNPNDSGYGYGNNDTGNNGAGGSSNGGSNGGTPQGDSGSNSGSSPGGSGGGSNGGNNSGGSNNGGSNSGGQSGGQSGGSPSQPNNGSTPGPAPIIPFNKPVEVITLVRTYCKACHAIGKKEMKFITSDLDSEVITYMTTTKTPSGVTWLDASIRSLSWPSNAVPADDAGYMPRGGKRFRINQNNYSSSATDRELLITKLKELKAKGP